MEEEEGDDEEEEEEKKVLRNNELTILCVKKIREKTSILIILFLFLLSLPFPAKIISARHLVKPSRGIASPFVEVEIVGLEGDSAKFKTPTIADNGLCPVWNEDCKFTVSLPELACIRFIVQDEDMFGDPNTIGQACFPIGSRDDPSLRPGM